MKTIVFIAVVFCFPLASSSALASCHGLETDGGFVTMADIPVLLDALQSTGKDGSFWVLLIPDTALNDGAPANLQFSIENGDLGLDWVLIAERNIKDKRNFKRIVSHAGYDYAVRKMNHVRYIRVVHSNDFTDLAGHILKELYDVKPNEQLRLIITGFEWPDSLTLHCSRPL